MNRIEIRCNTEAEMNYHIAQMKRYGYQKTNDCMWVVIYKKDSSEVTLIREY